MNSIKFPLLSAAVLLLGLTILLDAFGAHYIRENLGERSAQIWQTGTKYLLITGLAMALLEGAIQHTGRSFRWPLRLWLLGVIFFSGSLFILCFKAVISPSVIQMIGPITPIGGILMITGWMVLFIQLASIKR